MARYDAGWNRDFSHGYDAPFRGRRSNISPEVRSWEVAHGGEDVEMSGGRTGVYGPARYGLGPYYERLHNRKRPDDEVKEEVEEALFYDTWVDAEAIQVEVEDGIVTLRGELPNYEEVRYATDDAWDVDGVRGVRSELSVRER